MDKIEICRMRSGGMPAPRSGVAITVQGKTFVVPAPCTVHVVLQHDDYPLVTDQDVRDFRAFCRGQDRPVVSARQAFPHPYRLLTLDGQGAVGYLMDVPTTVRNNRHLYPAVFNIVPALVFLPAGWEASALSEPCRCRLYEMPAEKLLDRTHEADAMLLDYILHDTGPGVAGLASGGRP